ICPPGSIVDTNRKWPDFIVKLFRRRRNRRLANELGRLLAGRWGQELPRAAHELTGLPSWERDGKSAGGGLVARAKSALFTCAVCDWICVWHRVSSAHAGASAAPASSAYMRPPSISRNLRFRTRERLNIESRRRPLPG